MDEFKKWLNSVCFQKPTPEAYDLAKDAWKAALKSKTDGGAKLPCSAGLEGLRLDIKEDGFITIRQETGWLVWDGKIIKRPKEGYLLADIIRVAMSNKVPF